MVSGLNDPEATLYGTWFFGYVNLTLGAVLIWFVIKGLARRGREPPQYWSRALTPLVAAGRAYVSRAPLTFVYMAIWIATTAIVIGTSTDVVLSLDVLNSTNLADISHSPGRALLVSAFFVDMRGFGFPFYLLAFALIVARLEHRIGAARSLVVWAAAHIGASLLVLLLEAQALRLDLAGLDVRYEIDLGVSYVMVGAMSAYLLFVARWLRPYYAGALLAGCALSVYISLVNIGHVFAAVIGLGTGVIVARYGTRPALRWRSLVTGSDPCRPVSSGQALSPAPQLVSNRTPLARAVQGFAAVVVIFTLFNGPSLRFLSWKPAAAAVAAAVTVAAATAAVSAWTRPRRGCWISEGRFVADAPAVFADQRSVPLREIRRLQIGHPPAGRLFGVCALDVIAESGSVIRVAYLSPHDAQQLVAHLGQSSPAGSA